MKTKFNFRSVWNVLKYVLTPVLIWIVFRNVPFRGIWENLQTVNWGWMLLAVFFYIVQQFFFAVRWQVLLAFNRIILPFSRVVKFHLISFLFQLFLPSGFGGDAAKFALTFGKGGKVEALNSVLLARLAGLFILVIFALAGCFSYKGPLSDLVRVAVILFFLLFITAVLLLVYVFPKLERWKFLGRGPVFPRIMKILRGLRRNLQGRNLFNILLVSLFLQATMILPYFFIFLSLDLKLEFMKILIALPIITFMTMIVPTISGIGTREYFTWVFFAVELGTKQMLGSFALLSYFLFLIIALGGLYFWIESLLKKDGTGKKAGTGPVRS